MKLQYLSSIETGTAFPELYAETPENGKVSITRGTALGNTVAGNQLFITLKFTALASSGQTVVDATGMANAGGTPLTLAKGSVTVKFASSSAGGSASQTPASSPSSNSTTQVNQVDTSTSKTPDPAVAEVSNPENSESNEITSSQSTQLPAILGQFADGKIIAAGAISLLAAGTWLIIKMQRRAKNAAHFPELQTTSFIEGVNNPNSSSVPSASSESSESTGQLSAGPAQIFASQKPVQVSPQVIEPIVIQPSNQNLRPANLAPIQSNTVQPNGQISSNETPKVG